MYILVNGRSFDRDPNREDAGREENEQRQPGSTGRELRHDHTPLHSIVSYDITQLLYINSNYYAKIVAKLGVSIAECDSRELKGAGALQENLYNRRAPRELEQHSHAEGRSSHQPKGR